MKHVTAEMDAWVQKTLARMTLEEKVGQLIMTRPPADPHCAEGFAAGRIGGLYLTTTFPPDQLAQLKEAAPLPLIIAQDLESGNTSGGPGWPMAMAVSALGDLPTAYEWAYRQGTQARSFGINAAFGPVFDLAINPESQHTGIRGIGSDPAWTAAVGTEFVRGYQDAGILPFAKHFPGFGRGIEDPHMEPSNILADRETILREELRPYREAVREAGLMGIMTGHILAPAIDPDFPSPLSRRTFALLDDMQFDGLIISDSLSMKGITQIDPSENLYVNAILAGHDILLTGFQAFAVLLQAVRDGRIPLDLLERKVTRILRAKAWLERFPVPLCDLAQNACFFAKASEASLTCIRSDGGVFQPPARTGSKLFLVATDESATIQGELDEGISSATTLLAGLRAQYPDCEILSVPTCPDKGTILNILNHALAVPEVIVIAQTVVWCFTGTDHFQRPFISVVRAIRKRISNFVVWGNPYAVKDLPQDLPQYLFVYDKGPWVRSFLKLLRGEITPAGKLPVRLDLAAITDSACIINNV